MKTYPRPTATYKDLPQLHPKEPLQAYSRPTINPSNLPNVHHNLVRPTSTLRFTQTYEGALPKDPH